MSPVTLTVDADGIATLTLDRPDRHNALDAQTIGLLSRMAGDIAERPDIRAVVLTGAGRSFCAGADLAWMRRQFDCTRAERIGEALALATMLDRLSRLPQPLIGRINGAAYGGGLGLVSICDSAIARADASFAFTETRLGIIPATIAPYVLARMGVARARQVILSGRVFDGAEGVELGLFARAVPAQDLDAAIRSEIAPCLEAEPGAMRRAKALIGALAPGVDASTMEMTAQALADCWEEPAARARIGAFLDRNRA